MSQADPSLHRKPASQKPVLWPQCADTWSGLRHFTQRCVLFTTGWASLRLCDALRENCSSYSRPRVRISIALLLRDLGVPMDVNPITEQRCHPNFTTALDNGSQARSCPQVWPVRQRGMTSPPISLCAHNESVLRPQCFLVPGTTPNPTRANSWKCPFLPSEEALGTTMPIAQRRRLKLGRSSCLLEATQLKSDRAKT